MHAAIQLLAYWGIAFLTLGMAVVCLNIYFRIIGNDLELRSTASEVAIAAIAAMVEAAGAWAIFTFLPSAARALIIPVVIVAIIYKIAHYEDWTRFDIFMLLLFQAIVGSAGAALVFGHFQAAFAIVIIFAAVLILMAKFAEDIF